MRRPVENYDFLLLDTWEYCFRHYWFLMLAAALCGVPLGSAIADFITASPMYEVFEDYFIQNTGMSGVVQVVLLAVFAFYTLILYLLYRWANWRMCRKKAEFFILLQSCEQDVAQIETGRTAYSEAILSEFLAYRAAVRASELINENKARAERQAKLDAEVKPARSKKNRAERGNKNASTKP